MYPNLISALQNNTAQNGRSDRRNITVGEFNIPLSVIDRTSRQTDLADVYRMHHPTGAEHFQVTQNITFSGVQLLASLGHSGGTRVVLGHTLNTQILRKTDEQKKRF